MTFMRNGVKMNKKRISIIALFLLVALLTAVCVSCSGQKGDADTQKQTENVYAESVRIDETTIPSTLYAGKVSLSQMVLIVSYSNGDTERIPLAEEYIGISSRMKLSQIGTHQIEVFFENCRTSFQLTLEDPSVVTYDLVVEGGKPISVDGEVVENVKTDDDGVFRAEYPAGTEVVLEWTAIDNMVFRYWEADGSNVDNQPTTTVQIDSNHIYVAHYTEIVYTVTFHTFREDYKIGAKTVKKLYETADNIYDKKDVYSDYLPTVTMDNYVFSGWTTDYIDSLAQSSASDNGKYAIVAPNRYEALCEVDDVLSFVLDGKKYYFDSTGSVYADLKKTVAIADSSVSVSNKLTLSGEQYTYQEGKIFDILYNEVGSIVDTYEFVLDGLNYYFDIAGRFYLDSGKENTVKNNTFLYRDGVVYDTSYVYLPIEENITLYAVWLPVRLSYSPYTSFSDYGAAVDGYQVTEYMGNLTDLEIPDTYNGKKVLSIASSLFENNDNAVHVETVTVPASVIDIGEGTFRFCSSLRAIYVKQGSQVYSSENGVLYREERSVLVAYPANRVARQYELESNVSSVAEYAFYNAVIGRIVMPADVSSIGSYAFYSDHIDTIDFSDVVVTRLNSSKSFIGDHVFCDRLSSIIVSGHEAATEYEKLNSFDEFGDIISIGTDAHNVYTYAYSPDVTILFRIISRANLAQYFHYTAQSAEIIGITRTVKDITIPDYLTSGAVSYPVTSIGYHAFNACYLLERVGLPLLLERICDYAFDDTPWAQAIGNGLLIENNILYKYIGTDSTVRLPSGIERIAESAFWNNKSLEYINIGENTELNRICAYAFYGCDKLKSFSTDNDGSLYLRAAIEEVQPYAFMGTALRSIRSEEGSRLASLGDYAFCDCHYLVEIGFSSEVLSQITTTTFLNTDSLCQIDIPSNNSFFATNDGVLYQMVGLQAASVFLYPSGKMLPIYRTDSFSRKYLDVSEEGFVINGKFFRLENGKGDQDQLAGKYSETINGVTTTQTVVVYRDNDSDTERYYYGVTVNSIEENAFHKSNIGAIVFGKGINVSAEIKVPGLIYLEVESISSFSYNGLFVSSEYEPDYVYFPNTPRSDTRYFFNDENIMEKKYRSLEPVTFVGRDDITTFDRTIYAIDNQTDKVTLIRTDRTVENVVIPATFSARVNGGPEKTFLRKDVGKYAFGGWYLKNIFFESDAEAEQVGKAVGTICLASDTVLYYDQDGAVYTNENLSVGGLIPGAEIDTQSRFLKYNGDIYYIDENDDLCKKTGRSYEKFVVERIYYFDGINYYSDEERTEQTTVPTSDYEGKTSSVEIVKRGDKTYYYVGEKYYSDEKCTTLADGFLPEVTDIRFERFTVEKTFYAAHGRFYSDSECVSVASAITEDDYAEALRSIIVIEESTIGEERTYYFSDGEKVYSEEECSHALCDYSVGSIVRMTISAKEYILIDNVLYKNDSFGLIVFKDKMSYSAGYYYDVDGKIYLDESFMSFTGGTIDGDAVTLYGSEYSIETVGTSGEIKKGDDTVGKAYGLVTVNGVTFYYDYGGKLYFTDDMSALSVGQFDFVNRKITFEAEFPFYDDSVSDKIVINDVIFYYRKDSGGTVRVYADDSLTAQVIGMQVSDEGVFFDAEFKTTGNYIHNIGEAGKAVGIIKMNSQTYYYDFDGNIYGNEDMSSVNVGAMVNRAENQLSLSGFTYFLKDNKIYIDRDCTTEKGDIFGKIGIGDKEYYFGYNGFVYEDETCETSVEGGRVDFAKGIVTIGGSRYLSINMVLYDLVGSYYGILDIRSELLYHDRNGVYFDAEKEYVVNGSQRNERCDTILLGKNGYYIREDGKIFIEAGVGDFENNVLPLAFAIETVTISEKDTTLVSGIQADTFGQSFNDGLLIYVQEGTSDAYIRKWYERLDIFSYGNENIEASRYLIGGEKAFAVLTYKDSDGNVIMPLDPIYGQIDSDDLSLFRSKAKMEGYEVGGWTETVNGKAVPVEIGDTYTMPYNQKLLCTWVPRVYTVYIYIDSAYAPAFDAEYIPSKGMYKVNVEFGAEYNWDLVGYNTKLYSLVAWTHNGQSNEPKGYWHFVLDDEIDAGKDVIFYAVFDKRRYTLQYQSEVPLPNATVYYDSSFELEVPSKNGYTFVGWNYIYNKETIRLTSADGKSLLNWTITEGGDNDVYVIVPEWKANTVTVELYLGKEAGTVYKEVGSIDSTEEKIVIKDGAEETTLYYDTDGKLYTAASKNSQKIKEGWLYNAAENKLITAGLKEYYVDNGKIYFDSGKVYLYEYRFDIDIVTYFFDNYGAVYTDFEKTILAENMTVSLRDKIVQKGEDKYLLSVSAAFGTATAQYDSTDFSFGDVLASGIDKAELFAGWADADGNIYTDSEGNATAAWNKNYYSFLYAVWPLEVSTSEELTALLSDSMSVSVVLTSDITLSNICFGSAENPYTGVFNGNGKTVTYSYVGSEPVGYIGLFSVNKGMIKNLKFEVQYLVVDIDTNVFKDDKAIYIGTVCGVNDGVLSDLTIDVKMMSVTVDGVMFCPEDCSPYFYAGVVCAKNNGNISGQCVYHYYASTEYYHDVTDSVRLAAERENFESVWKSTYEDYYTFANNAFVQVNIPFEDATVYRNGVEAGVINFAEKRIRLGSEMYRYDEVGNVFSATDTSENPTCIGSVALRGFSFVIEQTSYTFETVYYSPIPNVVAYKTVDVSAYIDRWDRYYESLFILNDDAEFVPAGDTFIPDTVYYEPKSEEELYQKATDDMGTYLDGNWKNRYSQYYSYDGHTFTQVEVPYSPSVIYYKKVNDLFTDKSRFMVGTGKNTMSFTLKEYSDR